MARPDLYVNNNPYKYNDPNGQFANFAIGAIVGGLAEIALQVFVEGKSSIDWGKVGGSAAIGAVSGGAGGAAAKLVAAGVKAVGKQVAANSASNVIRTAGQNAPRLAVSPIISGAANGAVAGGVSSGTQSAITQYVETGTIDPNKVINDATNGAIIGAAAGGFGGAVQGSRANAIHGDSSGMSIARTTQTGANQGAAAGVATNAGLTIADEMINQN